MAIGKETASRNYIIEIFFLEMVKVTSRPAKSRLTVRCKNDTVGLMVSWPAGRYFHFTEILFWTPKNRKESQLVRHEWMKTLIRANVGNEKSAIDMQNKRNDMSGDKSALYERFVHAATCI